MQFDVHRNGVDSSRYAPFLLDIQADLLEDLATRIVVPLILMPLFGRRAGRLHPILAIDNQQVVMATHLVAAIRRGELGVPVASLRDQRDEIIRAIDILLAGV